MERSRLDFIKGSRTLGSERKGVVNSTPPFRLTINHMRGGVMSKVTRNKAIPVSEEHGVNPSMGICSICGKETGEILLLGRCNKYKCSHCGKVIYGKMSVGSQCPRCGKNTINIIARDVEAPRFISSGLCDDCKKMMEDQKAIVESGGVYWRCKDCGACGVIKADASIAAQVREKLGIKPPALCGVELTKAQCPVCQGRE